MSAFIRRVLRLISDLIHNLYPTFSDGSIRQFPGQNCPLFIFLLRGFGMASQLLLFGMVGGREQREREREQRREEGREGRKV